MNLSVAACTAALAAVTVLCNGGTLNVYSGTIPSTQETTATGTMLGTFASTAFGAPATGLSLLPALEEPASRFEGFSARAPDEAEGSQSD
jgi:hypothetical protein